MKPTSTGRLSKSWAQRLRLNGKPYDIGLGSYPTTTLATAREKALNNARMVAEGHDPRTRVAVVPRFVDALEIVIGLHRDNWKDGGKTESLWRRSLEAYAIPTLGFKPVSEIPAQIFSPYWCRYGPTNDLRP